MRNQALITPKDGSPDTLSEDLQALAAEIAKDLVPPEMIIGQWGLSEAEFAALLSAPEFDALLRIERAKWYSPENTNERVRAKSLMGVEDGMLAMSEIIKDRDAGPIARIKAFSELVRTGGADNAGIAKAKASGGAGAGSGERFSISIHLGTAADGSQEIHLGGHSLGDLDGEATEAGEAGSVVGLADEVDGTDIVSEVHEGLSGW